MPPAVIATVFAILGLAGLWGIQRNISSGTASSRGWACTLDHNPIGFCLMVCGKALCVGFSIAEILHAFGWVGDPVANLKQLLPFLP